MRNRTERTNLTRGAAVALIGAAATLLAVGAAGPLSSSAEAQMVNVRGRAMYGRTRLRTGFMPDPQILRGMAGGPVAGRSVNPSCRGYYAPNPSHLVHAQSGFRQLRFVVSAPQDTTLMVMLPNGQVVCDDDGGQGSNPLVAVASPPGRIAVWVGTYSSSSAGQVAYTLGLTELSHINAGNLAGGAVVQPQPQPGVVVAPGGLSPNSPPSFGQVNLNRGFMPDPNVLQGNAGGQIQASQINGSCRGYLSPNPNHVIYSGTGFQNLRLVGASGIDTTLVVMLPNGQMVCDDDGGQGSNPLVTLNSPPGRIAIWVGTYSRSRSGQAPYQLGITEYPHITASNLNSAQAPPQVVVQPPQVQAVGGLQPNAPATYGVLPINRGFMPDPNILSGNFGGPVSASSLRGAGACRGYLPAAPNHTVISRTGFPFLRVLVNAPRDTTLVILGPNGQFYCDDDGGSGNNPMVTLNNAGPGAFHVWVGSYSRSAVGGPYSIGFSELPQITTAHIPQPGAAPQQGVTVVPPGGNPGVVAVAQGLIGEAVQMTARIPVTLMGPGMTSPTIAAWQPRGGPVVNVGIPANARGSLPLIAQYNGQTSTLERVPASMAQGGVLTAVQQRNGDLVVRAEVAPGPGNPGRVMVMRVVWNGSQPTIADRWQGNFRTRPPRWAR